MEHMYWWKQYLIGRHIEWVLIQCGATKTTTKYFDWIQTEPGANLHRAIQLKYWLATTSYSHHPDINSLYSLSEKMNKLYFYLNKCHFVQASFINFVDLIVGYRNLQVYHLL
jgi:hypothetical protein